MFKIKKKTQPERLGPLGKPAEYGPWENYAHEGFVDWGDSPYLGTDGSVRRQWVYDDCCHDHWRGHFHTDWSSFVADAVQRGPLGSRESTDVRTEWTAAVIPLRRESDSVQTDMPAIEARKKRVGLSRGADLLGMKYDAFEQARKRFMRNNGRIPGEFRVGNQPAWYEDDLLAWKASRPRA